MNEKKDDQRIWIACHKAQNLTKGDIVFLSGAEWEVTHIGQAHKGGRHDDHHPVYLTLAEFLPLDLPASSDFLSLIVSRS